MTADHTPNSKRGAVIVATFSLIMIVLAVPIGMGFGAPIGWLAFAVGAFLLVLVMVMENLVRGQ